MKNKAYILPLGLILLLFVSIAAAMPLAEVHQQRTADTQGGDDSQTPPVNYEPIPVDPTDNLGLPPTGAAVFVDFLPWGSNGLFTTLTALSIPYTIYNSTSFATAPLSNYQLIIIAGDQDQNFYNQLAANMSYFDNYLQTTCGVLQAHTTGWGWNGGNPSGVTLPGGVTLNGLVADWDNYHGAPHPATASVPNPFTGTFASHGNYGSLIGGTTVIASEMPSNANPTLIEYPHVQGLVVAGMQPFTYGVQYGQDTGVVLRDLLNYTYYNAKPPCQEDVTYTYSVKFVCGNQPSRELNYSQVVQGAYATEINIHNFNNQREADIYKQIIPLVYDREPIGREPNYVGVHATDAIILPPDTATMDDCYRFAELLYPNNIPPTLLSMPMTIGFLEITSPVELHIDAVYTAYNRRGGSSIDVERVEGTAVTP